MVLGSHDFTRYLNLIRYLIASVILISLACTHTPSNTGDAHELTEQALADMVADAYSRCAGFDSEISIEADGHQLALQSRMTPTSMDNELMRDGLLLARFTLGGGAYGEEVYGPDGTLAQTVRYAVDLPGPESIRVTEQGMGKMGCIVGAYFSTWVGQTSRMPEYFRDRIAHGELVGDEEVDSEPCHVVRWERRSANYVRRDVFSFSKESLLLRRWKTFEGDGDKTVLVRSRSLRYTRLARG